MPEMKKEPVHTLSWNEFLKVEMRVGTVLEAKINEKVRKPAYVLRIDFGERGILKSSAQITELYQPEDLIGRQVIAVVNFPAKQIANIKSECLVLGTIGEGVAVTLIGPEQPVENGLRIA